MSYGRFGRRFNVVLEDLDAGSNVVSGDLHACLEGL